jgi:hypothetical protein
LLKDKDKERGLQLSNIVPRRSIDPATLRLARVAHGITIITALVGRIDGSFAFRV